MDPASLHGLPSSRRALLAELIGDTAPCDRTVILLVTAIPTSSTRQSSDDMPVWQQPAPSASTGQWGSWSVGTVWAGEPQYLQTGVAGRGVIDGSTLGMPSDCWS